METDMGDSLASEVINGLKSLCPQTIPGNVNGNASNLSAQEFGTKSALVASGLTLSAFNLVENIAMTKKHLVSLVAGSVIVALLGTILSAAPQKEPGKNAEHNQGFEACAKACSDCQRACDSCATHCAHMVHAGNAEHMKTLMSCQDCADACAAAAHMAARGGPYAVIMCEACADICARCAKECDAFPEDAHMKACADECRKCEKACREMTKHGERKSSAK